MMTRINSITVSPLQQHRQALGAIGDRSDCRPTAELMAHGPASLPGLAPFRIGWSLPNKDATLFRRAAAKKWPLRVSLELGVGCL